MEAVTYTPQYQMKFSHLWQTKQTIEQISYHAVQVITTGFDFGIHRAAVMHAASATEEFRVSSTERDDAPLD